MKKEKRKPIDVIIFIVFAVLVIGMTAFTATRETSNQEIILMEIYKSAGPNSSTASPNHYYIYENTNTIGIRSSNFDSYSGNSTNNLVKKEINQDLIINLRNALDEYISQNVSINTNFYINERYTFEYNGKSIIVPNPNVASVFEHDPQQYTFYYTVEEFINNINK